mgnify:FL=1
MNNATRTATPTTSCKDCGETLYCSSWRPRRIAAATSPTVTRTIDMGNNESLTRGVFPQADGTFLALTFSQSKEFKTRIGAERWLARMSKW